MDLTVENIEMPVVKANFEEVKAELAANLEQYRMIVATEENLAECKQKQKELASLRIKVDDKRKEIKKEFTAPITKFENQCKELIGMIEAVEQPIKDGIKIFDDLKRAEKKKAVEQIRQAVIAENNLNDKYAEQLTILDKYMNVTATNQSIHDELTARAMTLRVEQDREQEMIDIVKGAIEEENKRLNQHLIFALFEYDLEHGKPISEILSSVRAHGQQIYDAENRKEDFTPVVPEVQKEEPKEEPKTEPKADEPRFKVVIEMHGTGSDLRTVSNFLKQNNVEYKLLSQERV